MAGHPDIQYSSADIGENPNKETSLNGAPTGPFSHKMSEYGGDAGMVGDITVSGKNGETFYFK